MSEAHGGLTHAAGLDNPAAFSYLVNLTQGSAVE